MNWTQFLLSIAAVYSLYYLLNILFDMIRSRGQPITGTSQDELVFSEETQPKQIGSDEPAPEPKSRQAISSGPLISTGGVRLQQLFALAQSEVIEYTKAIPY